MLETLDRDVQVMEFIDSMTDEVMRIIGRTAKSVYSMDREPLPQRQLIDEIKSHIFEAIVEADELDRKQIISSAVSKYKQSLWGHGSAFYDRKLRYTTRKKAARKFYLSSSTLPWGEPLYSPASYIEEMEYPEISINEIFRFLTKRIGPDMALVFALKYGYNLPLTVICDRLFAPKDNKEKRRIYNAVQRALHKAEEALRNIGST